MSISYEKLEIPSNYKCSRCDAHGVKLWRQYNTMVSHLSLLCCRCAETAWSELMNVEGRSPSDIAGYKHMSDQLDDVVGKTGSLVPAVPTVEADTYWGLAQVPA